MPTLDWTALVWLAVAVVSAIVEVSVPHFGFIFVALAGVVSAVASAIGIGLAAQVIIFAATLAASLLLLRPRVIARLHGHGVPSRTDPLIGREGIVTTDIDPTLGGGRVNVGGEDWAARSAAAIAVGTRVKVAKADGIVLEVTRA